MADITLAGMLGSTDGVVTQFLTQTYPALADTVSLPVYYAAIIYVAIYGYKIMNGHEPINMTVILQKITLVVLALGALHWGGIANQIYGFFGSFAEGAASTIMAGQPTATMFDAFRSNIDDLMNFLLQNLKWYNIAIILFCMAVSIMNVILLVFALLNLIFAKVGLALVMLTLPLFIGFLFFEFTRQWFMNWLKEMIGFCFLYILTIAVIRFGWLIFADAIDQVNKTAGVFDITKATVSQEVSILIMQIVLLAFFVEVRKLASSLSGGISAPGVGTAIQAITKVVDKVKGGKK